MKGRPVLLALLLAALALRLFALGTPDLVGGDEGYYGTYARNILEGGFPQLLNLGREPLSAPDNKPFLFPLLLAGPVAVAGPSEWALRSLNVFWMGLGFWALLFRLRQPAGFRIAAATVTGLVIEAIRKMVSRCMGSPASMSRWPISLT